MTAHRVGSRRRKKADAAEASRFGSPRKKKAKVADETAEEEEEEHEHDELAVDRLTSLPDPVLVSILSLLPTRDAVKTLMIPDLGRLWDQTFNLDFDWSNWIWSHDPVDFKAELLRFFAFVDRAMALHRSPRISKFRLKIDGRCSYDTCCNWHVDLRKKIDAWLESAVRRNVETLDLDFASCSGVTLPASVLRSTSLVELRVAKCLLKPYPESCMIALRYLYLKRVSLSSDGIDCILSVCPVLEKLSLENCGGYTSISCESSTLKTVAISSDVRFGPQITVSGTYIASLYISERIEYINPGYLPSLDDATIDMIGDRFAFVPGEYVSVKRVFWKLFHAKVLTLHERPIVVSSTSLCTGVSNFEAHLLLETMPLYELYYLMRTNSI